MSRDEPETSQIAIAWALRNKSSVLSGAKNRPELSLCQAMLSAERHVVKPCQKNLPFQPASPDIWGVMANLCHVWAGSIEDPTQGSIAFHLHNVMPGWAVGLHPAALIGRRFFYNSPILNS